MKKRTPLAIIAATLFATASSHATTTLIEHNFGGTGDLNGVTVTTNNLSSATWVANSMFKANGAVSSAGPDINEDRGAYIDLGAGFAFATSTQYTLTLSYTGLSNAALFAGFMNAAPNVDIRVQNQHKNFALRARFIDPNEDTAAHRFITAPALTTVSGNDTLAAATLTLTLNTGANLADSTFSVDGSAFVPFDVTGHRYLYVGFEDNGISTATLTSLNFSQIPEPSAALLGSLGMLLLLRRRR